MWEVLAQGDFNSFRESSPEIDDLPAGTNLRLGIISYVPAAPLVNLWGMEWVIDKMYSNADTVVTGVRNDGWYGVIVDMQVQGTPPLLIIGTICAIIIIVGLTFLVRNMRLLVETVETAGPVVTTGLIVLGVGVLGLIGYGLYRSRR